MNRNEVYKLLTIAWNTKKGVLLLGQPSSGKSETVYKFAVDKARELGKTFLHYNRATEEEKREAFNNPEKYFVFYDLRGSMCDPVDIRGQMKTTRRGTTKFLPPDPIKLLSLNGVSGLLFLDELTYADDLVQKSFLSLVLDRYVDETPIADNVMIVAAGNEVKDGANKLLPALKTRFIIAKVDKISHREFVEYLSKCDDIPVEFVSFIATHPDAIDTFDPEKEDDKPQSLERSLKTFGQLLKYCQSEDDIILIGTATVGEATVLQYLTYLKHGSTIDFEKLKQNPEYVKELNIFQKAYLMSWIAGNIKIPQDAKLYGDILQHFEPDLMYITHTLMKNRHGAQYAVELTRWSMKNKHPAIERLKEVCRGVV